MFLSPFPESLPDFQNHLCPLRMNSALILFPG
jgi:hypothetical protein